VFVVVLFVTIAKVSAISNIAEFSDQDEDPDYDWEPVSDLSLFENLVGR